MPGPYPREFREDVVAVARSRESGVTIKQIAADFGISEATLQNWLRQADVEDGNRPGQTAADAAEAIASRPACASRHPRRPQPHNAPCGTICMWPISIADSLAPMIICP